MDIKQTHFGKLQLVEKQTLTADATTVTFSNLALDDVEAYILYARVENKDAAGRQISLYYNADTTATNYYRETLTCDNAAVSAARTNDGIAIALTSSQATCADALITKDPNGNVRARIYGIEAVPSGVVLRNIHHVWNDTASVTTILLTGSSANCIKSGSVFTLYKVTT